MDLGRDIFLSMVFILIIGSSFSLSVTENSWSGDVTVNNTICHDFGVINNDNTTISVTLKPTGEISDFTLFNTTTLSIQPDSTKYFRSCFTPTSTGQFNGSININNSGTLSPILITINSNPEQSQGSNGCSLLPSISQYNSKISQSGNSSFTIHIKNTCSQPITSITATIQNAKPDFAYITGNIPGQLDAGQTLDITVNVDGSKESEGQHNFYLTVSGFNGNDRITTNVNFNIYVVSPSESGSVGAVGNPSVIIPQEGNVNSTYQIAVSGISSSDNVFIDVEPVNYILKSVDSGSTYYKANYEFTKSGEYSVLIKIYHAGSLYYQTSKQVVIHPPSYTNTSEHTSIAKILWLVQNKIENNEPIKIEVRTEGGDPVDKAWVKITLSDGNFLSADTDKDGIVMFSPNQYGYQNGFPEGTATIDVRKTGFAQDMSSPHSIQIYINRIPTQIITSPNNISVGEMVNVKLVNKNTGELIDYNGQGKATSQNETINLNFKDGIATFVPNYNQTYSISVNKNDKMTGANVNVKVNEKEIVIPDNTNDNNNKIIFGAIALAVIVGLVLMLRKGGRRKIKPSFRYSGLGKVGSIKSSVTNSLPGEEENVVEVVGDNK